MPKSDQCSDGFVNAQKCYYGNCTLSRSTSNVWADSYLSIQVDEPDNTTWKVVNNRECVNQFGISLPESHCSGCPVEPKLELTWQLQADSWTNARDFCFDQGPGWRLFDHFDGKTEHLLVEQFNYFCADGTFPATCPKFWIGCYMRNALLTAVSDVTKSLFPYFKRGSYAANKYYVALYPLSSGNGEIVVNVFDNYPPLIFVCSRDI